MKNLLMAEDEEKHFAVFVDAIRTISKEINVFRTANGFETITFVKKEQPVDVIFLDVTMPFKNGLLALKEIRSEAKYKNTPIIILSSSAYPMSVKIAYDLNATFFVEKSASGEGLSAALKNIFESDWFSSLTQPPFFDFYVSVSGV